MTDSQNCRNCEAKDAEIGHLSSLLTRTINIAETYAKDLARYAAIFAADAGTDALYYDGRYTDEMAGICVDVALEAITRREEAKGAGKDFYACAFVEAAAQLLNRCHAATLEQLLDAGQRESDSLAGKGQ